MILKCAFIAVTVVAVTGLLFWVGSKQAAEHTAQFRAQAKYSASSVEWPLEPWGYVAPALQFAHALNYPVVVMARVSFVGRATMDHRIFLALSFLVWWLLAFAFLFAARVIRNSLVRRAVAIAALAVCAVLIRNSVARINAGQEGFANFWGAALWTVLLLITAWKLLRNLRIQSLPPSRERTG